MLGQSPAAFETPHWRGGRYIAVEGVPCSWEFGRGLPTRYPCGRWDMLGGTLGAPRQRWYAIEHTKVFSITNLALCEVAAGTHHTTLWVAP